MLKKSHKIIICTLTLIIIALGAGLYLNKDKLSDKKVAPPAVSTPYERNRNPVSSLSLSLKWEQTIGGSQNEELVDAFFINDAIYIFGNTSSSDKDMTNINKGFMAVLSPSGRTMDFKGISDSPIQRASIAEGGFLLATGSPLSSALLVGFDGKIIRSTPLFNLEQTVEEIILADYGYAVISSAASSGGKKSITVTQLSFDAEMIYQSVSSESYSLTYLNGYCMGEEVIIFAKAEGVNTMLTTGIYSVGSSPIFRYASTAESYTPFDCMPYSGGWVVSAIDNLGQSFLLKLTDSFAPGEKLLFNIGDCITADMRFYNGNYYVFVARKDGGFLATVNGNVSSASLKTQSEHFSYFNDYHVLRALSLENGIKLGVISGDAILKIPLCSTAAEKAILVGDYLIFSGKGTFGENDITVCLTDVQY